MNYKTPGDSIQVEFYQVMALDLDKGKDIGALIRLLEDLCTYVV